LSFFSTHPCCPHPALHSFPTRRSSDLLFGLGYGGIGDLRAVFHRPGKSFYGDLFVIFDLRTHASEKLGQNNARISSGSFQRTLRDRKSTRLNSSHVSISYAVFCLKKKI